eukprot:gnl/MRDRNA2_/MRDRNA2_31112_c0_seq1.p1 gnl/MRDRNA2_/MRDRNA2_31112_c0~~gnl/MRDRNA2_/MRDRNA2_31112_c0_seq1.p1  ORF type:complete len:722 (+),score=126.57 gnl/MRDRNA2_/MRDRNA2_31112_c0_seq1:93-2258(+)
MLKLLGIDESDTSAPSNVLPGYMLRLVIAVAVLGVAFTVVIIINALVLDATDRGGLQKIGVPVICLAAGAMLLLIAGVCRDVETPKSCCPKCSRLRTGGFFVLLLMVVPLTHLFFHLAIAGVVLAWLLAVEGVATRLRVVAVVEVILSLLLTQLLRHAGAWSDGYIGGMLLAAYAFGACFLPAMLVLGTVGERPAVARASCIGCGLAALHAAAIVLSGVSTLFASLLNNKGTSLHDERCIGLELDTPIMWFEKIVSDTNDKEDILPERYRSKGDTALPCIPQNISTTLAPLVLSTQSEEEDAASLGAAFFFLVVAVYAIAVVVTCSCFVQDPSLLVTPKKEEGEEDEEMDAQVEENAADEPPPRPRMAVRVGQAVSLSPKTKDRIRLFLKQLLGSTARLLCLGVFVMSAIGILVLWDVVVAKPESRKSSSNSLAAAPAPAPDSGGPRPMSAPTPSNSRNSSSFVSDLLGGPNGNRRLHELNVSTVDVFDLLDLNRRLQEDGTTTDASTTEKATTMAPPTTGGPSQEVEVENKDECYAWCADVKEDNVEKRCKIPGCTRCSICNLENCASWCLDVYPNAVDRCSSLACVNCPECELRPCGEDLTTTAAPTPPPRVERVESETPLASLPEEYIAVTWCSLGPWASIAVGTFIFSFHVLACSLAGDWASRFEGKSEDENLEDPNSADAQARMPRPGFSPASMLKREPQPAPSRLGPNNIRIFNI